MLEMYKLIK